MEWLMPRPSANGQPPRAPVLLSVCLNLDRLQTREHALHQAGYLVASASTVTAASEMSHLCKFDLVLLDLECISDGAATNLMEQYRSVLLGPDTTEEELLTKLVQVLNANGTPGVVH